jgi:hypothetical protein
MTRDALRAMPDEDVAALRWGLYARALAPLVRIDFDARLQDITDADRPPSAATLKARRAVQREDLQLARIEQARVRQLLDLDGEDD